ncbi:MAG: YfiR family protein [Candidatus Acidiferrum sp.]
MGLLLLANALLVLPPSQSQDISSTEYREKANFLAAFPNFIEWPTDSFNSLQAPFLLCVFGNFSFGTSLAQTTQGLSIHGRRIEVRWARKDSDLRACQILFVSRSEEKRYARIFKAIQGASVLTVGETPDFLANGGAINFLFEDDKLQFEVNVAAANGARLRISSNMLVLARRVIAKEEAAKS